jgi:hypothetical protein
MSLYFSVFYSIKSIRFNSVTHFSTDPLQNLGRFLNTTLAVRSFSQEANLVTPLSLSSDTFPLRNSFRTLNGVRYRPDLAYHTSAVLASTLDSLTLPWRMKTSRSRHSIHDLLSGLGVHGRKFAAAACAMPFPGSGYPFDSVCEMLPNVSADDTLGLVSLTPSVDFIKNETWFEFYQHLIIL